MSSGPDARAPFEGLFRLALRALPAGFRERNGGELLAVYRRRTAEGGRLGAAARAGREVADILATAVRLRWAAPAARPDGPDRPRDRPGGRPRAGHGHDRHHGEAGMGLEAWRQDLKLATRTTLRAPGFTAVAVLTLALGIGATTALFGVVKAVLLTPLPYADADRLVFVWQNDRATGTTREPAGTADYYDFLDRSRSFSALAGFASRSATLLPPGGEPRRLQTARVTAGLLDLLGVTPALGRGFRPEEEGPDGARVVMLSGELHREAFDADPGVLGATLSLDGVPHTVVGVLPEGLRFPTRDTDLWAPAPVSRATASRSPHWLTVLGRLRPEVELEAARSEMGRIAAELEAEVPENANRGAFVEPLPDRLRGDLRRTLWVVFAGTGLLLLVACANVANLLLARAAGRGTEVAVHAALGAGRGRIGRRFVLEGVLLSAGAAVGGTLLATAGLRVLERLSPPELVALGDARLDAGVLLFAVALAAAVGVGFGLVPALRARAVDLRSNLSAGRGGSARARGSLGARGLLVAGQVGLAAVLLVGAVLLGRTLRNLQAVDPGFRPDDVLRVSFLLPASRYPRDFAVYPDWPEVRNFHEGLVRRVEELPGVRVAAVALDHPLEAGFTNSFRVEGRDFDPSAGEMTTRLVSPGYFETVGLELVEGRLPGPGDRWDGEPILVLNRTAARRHFPDGDAIGSRIGFWGMALRRVVGIVEDERMHGLGEAAPPAMYADIRQAPPVETRELLLVRTAGDPTAVLPGVRAAVRELDPQLALFDVATLDETVAAALARERFASVLLGTFAAVALLLATLGVHGLLAYSVARRRAELGLRMALGASARNVVGLVVRQGLGAALTGAAAGLAVAWAASRLLAGLLYEVEATDPWTFLGVGVTLAAVALAAAALPARAATRTPPGLSLRSE